MVVEKLEGRKSTLIVFLGPSQGFDCVDTLLNKLESHDIEAGERKLLKFQNNSQVQLKRVIESLNSNYFLSLCQLHRMVTSA